MAEQYDGNGDFNYADGSSDFKRKNASSEKSDDDLEDHPIAEKVSEYLRELLSEKVSIDHKYPHAERLLEQEMTKVQQCGRIPQRDQKYVDIYREKQIRVTVKVLVPVKEHPKFNFVGKLLGPKGNSMKRLQEETMCKMAVLGRGSMKDRKKEEELRASLDPKYAHLNDDLHVEISALAPPAEAHARAAYALAEVRKYLIPDSNDCIRQEQMREMIADGTIQAEIPDTEPINPYKPYLPKHRTVSSHPPRAAYPTYGYPPRVATSGPPPRSPTSGSSRTVMPAKQKILSILDRARNAMEESYGGYEEPIYEAPPPAAHYDAYYPPAAPTSRSSRYEVQEYEPTEYRRDYYHREATAYPEMTKVQQCGRIPQRDQKYVDIYREKQIRVTVKVLVPVKEHPKFNFVGKLLGPKGNSMKRLQEETMCKMAVLGRGSMKDRKKEEELRASLDPKYAHLNDDLHVEISALAPPAEAHARAAYALAEVRKYLIPDSNDCIRQEQMREMIADGTIQAEIPDTEPINPYKPYLPKHRTVSSHPPRAAYPTYGYPPRVATSGPPPRSPTSGSSRTVMPAKQKILSILDRARNAMEESYGGYEEPIYEAPPPAAHYDAYYPPAAPTSRSSRYEVQEYEPTEYRRDYYHREATAYPVKTSSGAASRSSWKGSSSGYPSSSRHEETSTSKHSHASGHSGHSHSRDSRYRNSPYTRPSKL